MSIFHDLKLKALDGQELPLAPLKGKVVLVVNVASKCGLTPQYAALENLYQKYKDRGFSVLGLPCNQFAGQEPGSQEEIQEFCSLNYGVTFPLGDKLEGISKSFSSVRTVVFWRVFRLAPRRTIQQ
jgi:glutathione peroxidase